MKVRVFILLLSLCISLSGCKLIGNLTDLTDSARLLLDDIDQITRMIGARVESGELTREAGEFIDDRIGTLKSALEDLLERGGGVVYDVVNGTLNNVFANLSDLLDQIKTGILDDSLPSLIMTLSEQVQIQVSLIASSVEDIIVLAFGNTFVLVDKVTNSAVLFLSIILLAVGLLVFGLVLLRRGGKLKGLRLAGFIFMAVYVLFFLCLILVTPVRGHVIAGLNLGKKVEGLALKPKVTGVVPQTFVMGKNERIILYGNHLDNVAAPAVFLYQGGVRKFTFPARTVVEATKHKIILGNFGTSLGWRVPAYEMFKERVILPGASAEVIGRYTTFSRRINEVMFPGRLQGAAVVSFPTPAPRPAPAQPMILGGAMLRKELKAMRPMGLRLQEYSGAFQVEAQRAFGAADYQGIKNKISDFFLGVFRLPEGDFGIRVFDGETQVDSPQFITMYNPPPPPPKPDISPVSLAWTAGRPAIQGEEASLTVRLGFAHPEEVKRPFSTAITSAPSLGPIIVNVTSADVAAAGANNFVDVTTRPFRLAQPGDHIFQVTADSANNIQESNEGNNKLDATLRVARYVYDATVHFTTFRSKENMDNGDTDEYRIDVRTDVTGFGPWTFRYSKDGESDRNYSVDKQRTYPGLKPGDSIAISTSGFESDSGFRDGDDNMGSAPYNKTLGDRPTEGRDSLEINYPLEAKRYRLEVRIRLIRRIVS